MTHVNEHRSLCEHQPSRIREVWSRFSFSTRFPSLCNVVGLLNLFLILSGCQPIDPIPDDTLIIGQPAEPRSLDPHVSTSLHDFQVAANLYQGLVRFKSDSLEIEPCLTKSWEVLESDQLYRFQLRTDVRFHDGTPFDSSVVRFNFERMLNADHPQHGTGPFPLAFFFDAIERIETPDAYTVELYLNEPFAPLLSNLAYPTGFMVSPTAVGTHGRLFGRNPVGTGPFQFESWTANRVIRLQANPDYWEGVPALNRVLFRPLTDENARLTELLSGGCDVVTETPPDLVTYFREHTGFHVVESEGPHLWFLILNTRHGPFQNPKMRLAVQYAIDRDALVHDLLQDTATVAVGPIPRVFKWATDPELQPHPYDPRQAQRWIAEAGYEGAELTLYATEGGAGMLSPKLMAEAIQADLAAVGLKLKIETFEWNTYLTKVNAGLNEGVDMAQMAWMVNDPDTLLHLALRSEAAPEFGGFNSGHYSNPEIDALIHAARTTASQSERADLYRTLERQLHAAVPWVFVASWRQNAIASDSVQGLTLQPSFLLQLNSVSKSQTKP